MQYFDKLINFIALMSAFIKQFETRMKAICTTKLMLTVVIVVSFLGMILLHYLGMAPINIGAFSTKGAIYVDSPEIYTRERLVNDRYDQDFWLRGQLGKLDEPTNLVTTEIDQQLSVGVSNSLNPTVGQALPTSNNNGKSRPMPFGQDFRIRSAIRDGIRQLVLENMLDDRHDLIGNTVYGLKFDTTVIPGNSSQQRAFVRVKLKAEDPFAKFNALTADPEIPRHVYAFYKDSLPFDEVNGHLFSAKERYKNWLMDIESRLNQHLNNQFKKKDFISKCQFALDKDDTDKIITETIRKTIKSVLGRARETEENFRIKVEHNVVSIILPKPWVEYVRVNYSPIEGYEGCITPPVLTVNERWDQVFIFNESAFPKVDGKVGNHLESTKKEGDSLKYETYVKYGENSKIKHHILAFKRNQPFHDIESIIYDNFEFYKPSYGFNDTSIDLICHGENLNKGCEIWVPSGLFNFIEHIQKTDMYTYAVLPKSEEVGVLSRASMNLEMSGQLKGSSWLNFGQGVQESQLDSVLVGFGDSNNGQPNRGDLSTNQKEIQFGWVFGNRGNMVTTQKTELALISVPAWTTELSLTVTTGWLDRDAHEELGQQFDMKVPVPPDFQALDSLILKGHFQRKPKIMNDFMESDIKVNACENANILIPGTRLWRSAAVTLGAQKADRITVLPNMEGIIAEFTPVVITQRSEGDVLKAKLQVWTSEGVDTAENEIDIHLPKDNAVCPSKKQIY